MDDLKINKSIDRKTLTAEEWAHLIIEQANKEHNLFNDTTVLEYDVTNGVKLSPLYTKLPLICECIQQQGYNSANRIGRIARFTFTWK